MIIYLSSYSSEENDWETFLMFCVGISITVFTAVVLHNHKKPMTTQLRHFLKLSIKYVHDLLREALVVFNQPSST